MNTEIVDVKGREILDCRGDPTIEVEITTKEGISGRAAVPSGRSTGKHEAYELRDGEKRYKGKGVRKAVKNVDEEIKPALIGMKITNQRKIDNTMIELDGTKNKSKLGANSILGASLASAKTASKALDIPLYQYIGGTNSYALPVPVLDLIEGGLLAASNLDFQEHQVMPVGAKSFSEAIRIGIEVYKELGDILKEEYGKSSLNVGDEGGYTPAKMKDPRDALDEEMKAIEELGYEDKFVFSLDSAATHLYDEKKDKYKFMGKFITKEELIGFYEDLVSKYPIVSIEDPLHEEDFQGFKELTETLDIQIIGDDLFVTNPERLRKGVKLGAGNAVLLKVNQIGTLTEALETAELAYKEKYSVQVSERSGQTEDTWLADLSVGINSRQIKTGITRSERTSKYNRLLRIEEKNNSVSYAGRNFRKP